MKLDRDEQGIEKISGIVTGHAFCPKTLRLQVPAVEILGIPGKKLSHDG